MRQFLQRENEEDNDYDPEDYVHFDFQQREQ